MTRNQNESQKDPQRTSASRLRAGEERRRDKRSRPARRAAKEYPDDATSMSVPPPTGDARASSDAVGSPEQNSDRDGPSPHNKTDRSPAPPTTTGERSEQAGASKAPTDTPSPESVDRRHPARDTLETLRQEPPDEEGRASDQGRTGKRRGPQQTGDQDNREQVTDAEADREGMTRRPHQDR